MSFFVMGTWFVLQGTAMIANPNLKIKNEFRAQTVRWLMNV